MGTRLLLNEDRGAVYVHQRAGRVLRVVTDTPREGSMPPPGRWTAGAYRHARRFAKRCDAMFAESQQRRAIDAAIVGMRRAASATADLRSSFHLLTDAAERLRGGAA